MKFPAWDKCIFNILNTLPCFLNIPYSDILISCIPIELAPSTWGLTFLVKSNCWINTNTWDLAVLQLWPDRRQEGHWAVLADVDSTWLWSSRNSHPLTLIILIHGFSSETVYFCMVMEKLGMTLPSYPVSSKGILLCPPILPLDKSRYRVQYRDACKKNWLLLIHRDLFLSEHSSTVFNSKLYEYMSLYDKMKMDTEGNSSQLLCFIIVAAVISTSNYLQMKK